MRSIRGRLIVLLLSALVAGPAHGLQVDSDGNIELNFQFLYPPDEQEIELVKQQAHRASRHLCDATDGQMKLDKVRIQAGGPTEALGDVWYYPPGGLLRSSARDGRIYLTNGGRDSGGVDLADGSGLRSDVFAHEMGHLVLGLGDQYDEQRKRGTACGQGPSFDGGMDSRNNTIMQEAQKQVCVTAGGEWTRFKCFSNADCDTAAGETCPIPDLSSELSVAANFDLLRGDEVLPVNTCPDVRPGTRLHIAGFVGDLNAFTSFDATDLETAQATASRSAALDFIDSIGDVPGYGEGSAHPVWLFAEHTGTQSWTLHVGMDAGEFDEDDEGGLVVLDSYDLVFEAAPSETQSAPGEPTYDHRALISIDGLDPDVFDYSHHVSIDDLANGGDDADLEITIDLTEREAWNGGTFDGSTIDTDDGQQLGACGKTFACEKRFDTYTQRWEATAVTAGALEDGVEPQADWDQFVEYADWRYGLTIEPPDGLPAADRPESCNAEPEWDVAVEGVDQIFLVIDRSNSMNATRDFNNDIRTRLDWAKAGARGFLNLQKDSGVDVGLATFNGVATIDLPLATIVDDGAAVAGEHEIGAFQDAVGDVEATGYTAIGDALALVRDEFLDEDGERVQAVYLLSDGSQTAGTADPEEMAEELGDLGIQVYTLPVGNAASGEIFWTLAEETDGDVYEAEEAMELPGIYADLYARLRGETPILSSQPVTFQGLGPGEPGPPVPVPFDVEPGASRLNVMITNTDDQNGGWEPGFELWNPAGEVVLTHEDDSVVHDPYFRLARVGYPDDGTWLLWIFSTEPGEHGADIWVHAENPAPDCWAGVEPRVVTGPPVQGVPISVGASWGAPVGRGSDYLVKVIDPMGIETVVPMELNDHESGAEGRFHAFNGRGRYTVEVTCAVPDGSRFTPGEHATLESVLEQGRPERFGRMTRTSFFLDVPDPPVPPPWIGDDCDGDGLPDVLEGWDDTDGDGLADACDEDTDGDDIPDSDDGNGDPDGDGLPNWEDADSDSDGVPDGLDNCHTTANASQADQDGDGVGDACDDCIEHADPDQTDSDGDGYGNACDADFDGDGSIGIPDFPPFRTHFATRKGDPDYDPAFDLSGDGVVGIADFQRFRALFGGRPGPSAAECRLGLLCPTR